MNDDKIKFEKKLIKFGDSRGVTIPLECLGWLSNPEEVYIMPDTNKKGQKYIAIWKKDNEK